MSESVSLHIFNIDSINNGVHVSTITFKTLVLRRLPAPWTRFQPSITGSPKGLSEQLFVTQGTGRWSVRSTLSLSSNTAVWQKREVSIRFNDMFRDFWIKLKPSYEKISNEGRKNENGALNLVCVVAVSWRTFTAAVSCLNFIWEVWRRALIGWVCWYGPILHYRLLGTGRAISQIVSQDWRKKHRTLSAENRFSWIKNGYSGSCIYWNQRKNIISLSTECGQLSPNISRHVIEHTNNAEWHRSVHIYGGIPAK